MLNDIHSKFSKNSWCDVLRNIARTYIKNSDSRFRMFWYRSTTDNTTKAWLTLVKVEPFQPTKQKKGGQGDEIALNHVEFLPLCG